MNNVMVQNTLFTPFHLEGGSSQMQAGIIKSRQSTHIQENSKVFLEILSNNCNHVLFCQTLMDNQEAETSYSSFILYQFVKYTFFKNALKEKVLI